MRSWRLFFVPFGSLIPPEELKTNTFERCGRSLYREAKGLSLEENLQGKLQRSSFARKRRTKVVEDAALLSDEFSYNEDAVQRCFQRTANGEIEKLALNRNFVLQAHE